MGNRRLIVAALFALSLAGCEEPQQIVNVTAPGQYTDRTPEEEKGLYGPQAIGEAGVTKASGPVSSQSPVAEETKLETQVRGTIESALPAAK